MPIETQISPIKNHVEDGSERMLMRAPMFEIVLHRLCGEGWFAAESEYFAVSGLANWGWGQRYWRYAHSDETPHDFPGYCAGLGGDPANHDFE
jgi:hypothetical protein